MIKTQITAQMSEKVWGVYTLTYLNEVRFIGIGQLSSIFSLRQARMNPYFSTQVIYDMEVIAMHGTAGAANEFMDQWCKENGKPEMNLFQPSDATDSKKVCCTTTGQVFQNASQCAKSLGINQSQLSQHLQRKPGYRTIKGMSFDYIHAGTV